jgi:spore coat protein CotH
MSEVIFLSCFPHIVNLACKAVLAAITNLKYAEDLAEGYEDYEPALYDAKDCIATVRSLVNAVSTASQNMFNSTLTKIISFDVITRWSSTLLMIAWVLKLKEVNSAIALFPHH